MNFNEFGKQCFEAAKAKGFYANPPTTTQLNASIKFLSKIIEAAQEFEAERKRKSTDHVGYCESKEDLAIVKTALLASEVAEAGEWALRRDLDDYTCTHEYNSNGDLVLKDKQPPKPEGYASELADVLIRLADQTGLENIDLDFEVKRKQEFNAQREWMNGKSF